MSIFSRHFVVKHPLFRKTETDTGIEWRRSVYYLWWEYLRRHEGYKLTCEKRGVGKYSKLYRDFGDIHATDFKTWWTSDNRGARLFGEPAVPMSVAALSKEALSEVSENWNENSMLVVAVPLFLPKRFIEQRFREILRTCHSRKRGQRQLKESRAQYPITHQFNFPSLELALRIYDLKQQQPELTLWKVTQSLEGFGPKLRPNELGKRGQRSPDAVEKKNQMSVAAFKKLKQAKLIIENVGEGLFPGPF